MDTKSDQTAAPLNNADILAQLIGDKRSTFWLGHYSENEVLHLLAKFDILPVLKAKGCDHPLIIIEPLEAFEQALKIFNSTVTTENLFVELRLHETSFSHPNLLGGAPQPMLKIDWLMLQNPAAPSRLGSCQADIATARVFSPTRSAYRSFKFSSILP